MTIRRSGKVTWENPTDATHHVTFWDGPGGKHRHLDPGGSATLKLRKPGVYKYLCDITFHADIVDVAQLVELIDRCANRVDATLLGCPKIRLGPKERRLSISLGSRNPRLTR